MQGVGRLPHADKAEGFAAWLRQELAQKVFGMDGSWLRPFIRQAAGIAQSHATGHVPGSSVDPLRIKTMENYAVSELRGIVEAAQQQMVRKVTESIMAAATPMQAANALAPIFRTMQARTQAMVHTVIVKAHATLTLSAFRGAGITHVGIIPEKSRLIGRRLHDADQPGHPFRGNQFVVNPSSIARSLEKAGAVHESRLSTVQKALEKLPIGHVINYKKETWTHTDVSGDKFWASNKGKWFTARQLYEHVGHEALIPHIGHKALGLRDARAPLTPVLRRRGRQLARLPWTAVPGAYRPIEEVPSYAEVDVETAGDNYVCQICEDIAEDSPYELDDAENLIPVHPNCRCAFVPAGKGSVHEFDSDQIDAGDLPGHPFRGNQWTAASGGSFIAEHSKAFQRFGFAAEIIGSVASKGESKHDLDLRLTPTREDFDYEKLQSYFEKRGFETRETFAEENEILELRHPDGRTIDLWFGERPTSDAQALGTLVSQTSYVEGEEKKKVEIEEAEDAEGPGHPFRGNQYVTGEGGSIEQQITIDPHSGIEKVQLSERKYPVRDTAAGIDEHQVRGAATIEHDGSLSILHITDNPERVEEELKGDHDLAMGSEYDDLGKGFYGSAMPNIWASRSAGKWDFLKTMTPEQTRGYVAALQGEIAKQVGSRYITESEYHRAMTTLGYVEQGKLHSEAGALLLAEQPYNIRSWTPQFLGKLGIEGAKPPSIMKINVSGRFVDLSDGGFSQGDVETARKMGFDGAYTRNSFSHIAQFVLWKRTAIVGVSRVGHQQDAESLGHPFHGNQYVQVQSALKPEAQRAFEGEQVPSKTKLTKLQKDEVGEQIMFRLMGKLGLKNPQSLNEHYGVNNYPLDLAGDHLAIELKTGDASNGPSGQQWNTKIGQMGPAEQAKYDKMSPEKRRIHNDKKMKDIIKRKYQALARLRKETGVDYKPWTFGVILDTDRKVADIHAVPGYHPRIGYKQKEAQDGYVTTVKYK
jgi:hypothetical protein